MMIGMTSATVGVACEAIMLSDRIIAMGRPPRGVIADLNDRGPTDWDLLEINEAYAATPLVSTLVLADGDLIQAERIRELPTSTAAPLAIGHPLGASGARIVMTLINGLRARGGARRGGHWGGFGQGDALWYRLRERERIAEKVDDVFAQACPKQGKGAALIFPACNTEANLHLAEIALMVAPGAHAVLLINLVDGICPRDCSFPPKTPFSPCRKIARAQSGREHLADAICLLYLARLHRAGS